MRPMAVKVLQQWVDPFANPQWQDFFYWEGDESKGLRGLVQECLASGTYVEDSYSALMQGEWGLTLPVDARWHAARIAHLMRFGWSDALTLNVDVVDRGTAPRARLEDGNHRFAAAILLEHEFVNIDVLGDACHARLLLGERFFHMPEMEECDFVQVAQTGKTVWVHAPHDGSTVGRFDWDFGMDVHNTVSAQMDGAGQCLNCTHEAPGYAEWLEFCASVWKNHGLCVDPAIMQARAPELVDASEARPGFM